MKRSTLTHSLAPLLVACIASSCGPEEESRDVGPTATIEAALLKAPALSSSSPGSFEYFPNSLRGRWISKWDNPVIEGAMDLRPDQFGKRLGDAWEYYKFDLELRETGAVNSPGQSVVETLYTWPTSSLTIAPNAMTWEAHGTRLPPRVTLASTEGMKSTVMLRDDWDLPELAHGPSVSFQLSPDVSLVPVEVVVLVPPGGSAMLSVQAADVLLDDVWFGHKTTVTNPNEFPHDVVTDWQKRDTSLIAKQPDRILDQCSVQFRKVAYTTCAAKAEEFDNVWTTQPQVCRPDSQAAKIEEALKRCGLGPATTTRLVFTGSLVNQPAGCQPVLGAGKASSNTVYITVGGLYSKNTVAHELAHRLGLDHISENQVCPEPDNLMCPVGDEGTKLKDTQCGVVKSKAKSLQAAFWP